jgi:hypothetical protein
MKTFAKLSILIPLFLTACSGTYQTAKVHDDIYFSPSNAEKIAESAPESNVTAIEITPSNESQPAGSYSDSFSENKINYQENADNQQYEYLDEPIKSDTYYDEDGNLVINNYYMDGYHHDYYYESRIRRFHRNWAHFGYYDPFFTNSYWYNYNPYYIGSSIYMGYDPFFSFGYFPGSYYSWGYRPWAWAHYGYGWGYGNPWGLYGNYYGYNAGYHRGYWDSYYGYNYWGFGGYYSTEDYVLSSRRPSNPITETDRAPGRYRNSSGIKNSATPGAASAGGGRYGVTPSTGNTNETASDAENPARINGENNPVSGRRGSEQIRNTEGNSVFVEPRGVKSPESKGREAINTGIAVTKPGDLTDNNQQEPREYTPQRRPQEYARPERVSQTPKYQRPQQPIREGQPVQAAPSTNRTRTYTSPSQQQPRSNQEYRRPTNEQRPVPVNRQPEQQARPQRQSPQRPQATPARQPVQTRPQATPQRSPRVEPNTPQRRATPQRSAPQSRPQAAPSRAVPQSRPQAAPQRSAPQSRPQAAPSRAPQRSTPSYTPSRSSGSSSSGVRSSSPSRSSGNSSSSSSPSRRR